MDSNMYDGETACLECGVVICAYCQGSESECPGSHRGGCQRDPSQRPSNQDAESGYTHDKSSH
mgnify:CR=1 FL=1